jgi:cysteine synthase
LTSGNMGIAYATLGAAFNIPVTLTLPANASPNASLSCRRGAELFLTNPLEMDGAIQAGVDGQGHPDRYYYASQYDSGNWQAPPPPPAQTFNRPAGWLPTRPGLGTSGTLTGTALSAALQS